MGEACSTYGIGEMYAMLWLENLKGRDHSENVGVGWRIILEWILEK
jgi:hypothetical protein